jgi:hypothetical protein
LQAACLTGAAPPSLWRQLNQQALESAKPSLVASMHEGMGRGVQKQAKKQFGRACEHCGLLEAQMRARRRWGQQGRRAGQGRAGGGGWRGDLCIGARVCCLGCWHWPAASCMLLFAGALQGACRYWAWMVGQVPVAGAYVEGKAQSARRAVVSDLPPHTHMTRPPAQAEARGEHLQRCAGCQAVWYCGKDCQKAAWRAATRTGARSCRRQRRRRRGLRAGGLSQLAAWQ